MIGKLAAAFVLAALRVGREMLLPLAEWSSGPPGEAERKKAGF